MSIDTIKMSSKGQIVIPNSIRELIGAHEGTVFAVTSSEDTVVLKKVDLPSKEELISKLSEIAKNGKQRLQKKGLNEAYLQRK